MFTIGRLARASRVTKDTIRFYDRLGLLHPPTRTDCGYRLYDRADVRRLALIRHAQRCGLSLQGIRELMQLPHTNDARGSAAYWAARRELPEIEGRITALQTLRGALRTFLGVCDAGGAQAGAAPSDILSEALEQMVAGQPYRADRDTSHAAARGERDTSSTVAA